KQHDEPRGHRGRAPLHLLGPRDAVGRIDPREERRRGDDPAGAEREHRERRAVGERPPRRRREGPQLAGDRVPPHEPVAARRGGGDVGSPRGAVRLGFGAAVNGFGFAPFHNRFAVARLQRFEKLRFFALAAAPFGAGVGLYGGSCWSWQPTPWGWQRVWGCGYD